MVQALPAVIEPTSTVLVSQRISPSRTKARWALWHRRLAHLGFDSMKLLFGGLSTGFSIAREGSPSKAHSCEGCIMGKIVRPPFPSSTSHAKETLDLRSYRSLWPYGSGLNWRRSVCHGDCGRSFEIYLGFLSASEVRCTEVLQAVLDQSRTAYRTQSESCPI